VNELSKSIIRRLSNPNFITKYFVGAGIDIGGGADSLEKYNYLFPNIKSVRNYDRPDGDAQDMPNIKDNVFDFVHSSHCLEHLDSPIRGLNNWLRIVKPRGYLIITVPDEDLYEQGVFPSDWSNEHKWSFAIFKEKGTSWNQENSINIIDLITKTSYRIEIEKIELLSYTFNNRKQREDQTLSSLLTESCIEFVIKKVG
jgi:SAM-dependent methyltransferase